ncbi:hypothetical protein BACUNI_01105 [Bacteroides uniformis ATCC 8492]|uniref:Uncharacterized protein n=1 Tax=Bacteroides uniformis (strain ATCC 8492 / DSM 6597 / CCUG 4942 / CIP 103695 / JCM 5828 / KCTC 5204 / NCTC 13054 / VPI 0061) TaxID=411479 RepID=A0ABC9NFJ6_BACUC|nr:hypothetical protein BACUNI_01105 [Bacteroides uniformis ATCC 8492]
MRVSGIMWHSFLGGEDIIKEPECANHSGSFMKGFGYCC